MKAIAIYCRRLSSVQDPSTHIPISCAKKPVNDLQNVPSGFEVILTATSRSETCGGSWTVREPIPTIITINKKNTKLFDFSSFQTIIGHRSILRRMDPLHNNYAMP
jgi:hypothetical protein